MRKLRKTIYILYNYIMKEIRTLQRDVKQLTLEEIDYLIRKHRSSGI